jgi:hypothetical protein
MARDSTAVIVSLTSDGITVEPASVPNFQGMRVRIISPGGYLVLDEESIGEPVTWLPAPGTPDGFYRYEAVVVTRDERLLYAGDDNSPAGLEQHRASGSFVVTGGQISPPRRRASGHGR